MSASSSPSLQASFISSVMQQPWPACRSAEGGLYAWSQSTPNSIMLEGVSCVSSAQRLFTCAEPHCYFASPSVFIMMALFCLFWGGGRRRGTNMPSLDPPSFSTSSKPLTPAFPCPPHATPSCVSCVPIHEPDNMFVFGLFFFSSPGCHFGKLQTSLFSHHWPSTCRTSVSST